MIAVVIGQKKGWMIFRVVIQNLFAPSSVLHSLAPSRGAFAAGAPTLRHSLQMFFSTGFQFKLQYTRLEKGVSFKLAVNFLCIHNNSKRLFRTPYTHYSLLIFSSKFSYSCG
jgi:hypothetical protein